ncbi:MAG: hypothetical protein OQK58_02945 [Gammaproteobacteria bacterium]|nr:hypothetical protein [Gammaproteobacteria bacterium]
MPLYSTIKKNIIKAGSTKILLAFLFIIAITFNFTQTLDTSSKQHIDKAFNRALIAFGIAKSLNGVISVAQGTEVAIQPAGIGINLTPGQILDPVNDLIERFSWVMLASTTSLGIQKIFLTMSSWPAFGYTLIFFLLLGFIMLFTESRRYFHIRIFILRLSLLLIVLRFAVPMTGLANEAVYSIFLEKEYTSSTDQLESAAQQIGELNDQEQFIQPNIKKKSVWESAKEFYNSTSEMLDINKKIEQYKQAAEETTQNVVNLIVIFLFQTAIIPLAFIFIVYSLFKYIIRLKFN